METTIRSHEKMDMKLFFFTVFEIGSHSVTLSGLELCVDQGGLRLTEIYLHCFLNSTKCWIKGERHACTQPMKTYFASYRV